MMQTPLDKLRAALPHPLVPDGQVRGQYRTNCPGPGHKNGNHHNPALSVTETTPGGKVLINCHVGCSPEDTVAAINLKLSDLFTADGEVQTLTIEEYSRKKRLPLDFLRKRGVSQYGKALLFRYYCKDGKEARSQLRLRSGKQPWKKDDHREIEPYGLDLLGDSEYAALVEGCSDGLTLQLAGFSVIGIPGNTMQSKLKAEHIAGIKRAYITREFKGEGDTSGDTFVRLTRWRLRRLGFKGEVCVVDMEPLGAGDPSDLYISDTANFPTTWQKALDDAKPLALDDEDEDELEAPKPRVLVAKTLNVWLEGVASSQRPRKQFGECFHENETCIFFGDTNLGKSLLGVMIAQALASGTDALPGFENDMGPMKIIYFDFELSARQFLSRYSDQFGHRFPFHDNLIRVEVTTEFDWEGDWATVLSEDMEALIAEYRPGAVFVDNLTAIQDDTEKARSAIPLMRRLNTLKRRYETSLLAFAHTPKRDATKPLSKNDLAGSRNLLNLCDSCFAIGESYREDGVRYLKQIKVREADFSLTTENVALLSLEKRGSFLGFQFTEYGSEVEHLQVRTVAETNQMNADIVAAHLADKNLSQRKIAEQLGTDHKRVGRVLKRHYETTESGAFEEESGAPGANAPPPHPSKMNGIGSGALGQTPHVSHSAPPNGNRDNWKSESTADIEGDDD